MYVYMYLANRTATAERMSLFFGAAKMLTFPRLTTSSEHNRKESSGYLRKKRKTLTQKQSSKQGVGIGRNKAILELDAEPREPVDGTSI